MSSVSVEPCRTHDETPVPPENRRAKDASGNDVEPRTDGAPLHSCVGASAICVAVPTTLPTTVLALGADLKNTVCFATGRRAWISESHGDLADAANYRRLYNTVAKTPTSSVPGAAVIAHDLHPAYLSTNLARSLPGHKVAVQHHHAHAVSCAVDAGVTLPVIAIVCDGTGYGTDGAIWGGEVLLCEAGGFDRMAHLDYFDLPGGDAAARFPWRPAVSLLRASFPGGWRQLGIPALRAIDTRQLDRIERQLDVGLNVAQTSSLGRLFDAVSCLAGLCVENTHEGEAAIALQCAAEADEGGECTTHDRYPFEIREGADAAATINWRPMIRRLVEEVAAGVPAPVIAARFHATVIAMFAEAALAGAARTGVDRVVLSGGCFMNRLLREGTAEGLRRRGLTVAVHERVSCGDAGLSLGQAVIAAHVAAEYLPPARGVSPCA